MAAVFSRLVGQDWELALFQRKKADVGGGHWEFPGGKVDPGETFAQALVREIQEELGLTIEVEDLLGTELKDFPGRTIELHAYWVKSPHFGWTLHEHDGVVWVKDHEWQNLDISPVDLALIEKAFTEKQKSG